MFVFMKNRPRLLAILVAQAHGFISYQPTQLRSLRSSRIRHHSTNNQVDNDEAVSNSMALDRRGFLGAFGGLAVLGPSAVEAAYFADDVGSWKRLPSATEMSQDFAKLEKVYSLRFFEYLARILLNHDSTSATWWEKKAKELPPPSVSSLPDFAALLPVVEDGVVRPRGRRMADGNNEKSATGSDELEAKVLARYANQESRVREARRAQYSEFVAALELSVARDYAESPSKLLKVLSTQPGWFQTLAGKRQLAILFTFVQSDRQPTEAISRLLRDTENRTVTSIEVEYPGAGYTAGEPPLVTVSPPLGAVDAQSPGKGRASTASAEARLEPSGQVLRVEVVDGGSGYSVSKPPNVYIEAPARSQARATAEAIVDKASGRVVAIELTSFGNGYGKDAPIDPATESYYDASKKAPAPPPPPTVVIEPPPQKSAPTKAANQVASNSLPTSETPLVVGSQATAVALLDYQVAAIFVTSPGFGYSGPGLTTNVTADGGGSAVVTVAPPPMSADTSARSKASTEKKLAARAVAVLSPPQRIAEDVPSSRFISGASSALPPFPMLAGESSSGLGLTTSSKLTQLLPNTLPVYLDPSTGRFRAALGDGGMSQPSSGSGEEGSPTGATGYDPVFGPRAANAVYKDEALSVEDLGKLAFSGAICASAAHFLLTPIELTKTRMQLLSQSRASAESALKKKTGLSEPLSSSLSATTLGAGGEVTATIGGGVVVVPPPPNPVETLVAIYREEGGLPGLFQGADSSAVGYFVAGAFGFSLTELFRRQLVAGAGGLGGLTSLGLPPSAATIAGALAAGVVATIAVAPFEKARVKLQKGSEDGSDVGGLGGALVSLIGDERGWVSGLFDGVPLLLAKEIVWAVVKFQSFDTAKGVLFALDPHLREGLTGTLFVSLAAGAVAGVLSSLASQPGDTVFTKLSSAKKREPDATAASSSDQARGTSGSEADAKPYSSYGPLDALQDVLDQQGLAGMYAGAAPRAFFSGSLLALEFLIYDGLRAFFHVTSGDLTVGLDVLAPLVESLSTPP